MKIAIFESIITPGGHEVDFDRIIVDEMKKLGHEVFFYVPEDFEFKFDYGVSKKYLKGKTISYTGKRGISKIISSFSKEYNRQKWYKQLYKEAVAKNFDAIIIPTSTYRYLRALNINELRKSPVPVIFILHGINPKEAPAFFKEAKKLQKYHNIKMIPLVFTKDVLGEKNKNIYPIYPPTYTPRDIDYKPQMIKKEIIKIGFFGQYRKEKKLEDFLNVFIKSNYKKEVELLVQGSTMKPDDSEDFERIKNLYSDYKNISFLHKGLLGAEWQQAISEVDVLLMPYSAPRYKYHWGGMLFTAIGYHKPVVASDDINPEVWEKYNIGMTFKSSDLKDLKNSLEEFINTFDDKFSLYKEGLDQSSRDFSPKTFAENLINIIKK